MLALEMVEKLRQVAPGAANVLTTLAVKNIVPLAAAMGYRVEEVTDTRTRASVPLNRKTKNHVGSVYLGAQVTVMELTMGVLLFRRFPPSQYKLLVNRMEVSFHAKAKSTVSAVCEPPPEVFTHLESALRNPGDKAETWVPVKLLDSDGKLVAESRFLAVFKRS
jgi:acyl-coenzyme A thioesterase PaaI-like protein